MKPTITLKPNVWTKVKKCAEAGGYSTPQEFVEHVIEKEIARLDDADSEQEIARKLKGLGYLD